MRKSSSRSREWLKRLRPLKVKRIRESTSCQWVVATCKTSLTLRRCTLWTISSRRRSASWSIIWTRRQSATKMCSLRRTEASRIHLTRSSQISATCRTRSTRHRWSARPCSRTVRSPMGKAGTTEARGWAVHQGGWSWRKSHWNR